ncbi:MAG: hypothetical protein LBS82_02740 [Spirochaetaceae bacterium]|jgi:hypothetical protein|nr:hypothetical protein [Spirochaetaceae bacterium]
MGDFIHTSASLFFGAFSVVFAIVLWSGMQETAWLFVILGVVSRYAETIHTIFKRFGVMEDIAFIDAVPVVDILFATLPSAFFICAFLIMILKKTRL